MTPSVFSGDVASGAHKKAQGMRFEICRASGGQYYWRIVGSNGQVLATSETYYNEADAQRAAELVRSQMASAPIYGQGAS
jgi:uncharacterized protein YegP (UPF0339 family)